jgi:hypothetical protein
MIKLSCAADDNESFLLQIENVIRGAIKYHCPRLCGIYKIDNWFDHKWLGFFHGAFRKGNEKKLARPPFSLNRLLDGKFYLIENKKPLLRKHLKAPELCQAWEFDSIIHTVDEFTINPQRMLAWYSGNTAKNKRGVAMFYLLPEGRANKETSIAFYISCEEKFEWEINKVKGISVDEFHHIKNS